MRSHDYCHFEAQSSATINQENENPYHEADIMRKGLMRVVDKAVKQYKIAKVNAQRLESEGYMHEQERQNIERIRTIAEPERTVKQQAALKAWDDAYWASSREYDYQDDWDNDDQN